MISRLAMRENTTLLVEALALALLVRGLRYNAPFPTFSAASSQVSATTSTSRRA